MVYGAAPIESSEQEKLTNVEMLIDLTDEIRLEYLRHKCNS